MSDPIADMLNRIRNAQAVLKNTVDIPFSVLKYEIANILKKNNFIEKVGKKTKAGKKIIRITLKYHSETSDNNRNVQKQPMISGLKRISKPGQRIYSTSKKMKKVQRGYGIAIISTSKGLMTDKEARKQNLGGEVICEIW